MQSSLEARREASSAGLPKLSIVGGDGCGLKPLLSSRRAAVQLFGDKAFELYAKKHFVSLHFTDQGPNKKQPKVLNFEFSIPKAQKMTDVAKLMASVFYFIDSVAWLTLSPAVSPWHAAVSPLHSPAAGLHSNLQCSPSSQLLAAVVLLRALSLISDATHAVGVISGQGQGGGSAGQGPEGEPEGAAGAAAGGDPAQARGEEEGGGGQAVPG